MHRRFFLYLSVFISCLLTFGLAGCSTNPSSAPLAVESYFRALEAKDINLMINSSCAEWEADARTMYDSFAAVDITIEDMVCQQGQQQGDYTLVSCSGKIIADYFDEDLVIELSDFTYKTVEQNGVWLMCGN